jgi:hypothetical protein
VIVLMLACAARTSPVPTPTDDANPTVETVAPDPEVRGALNWEGGRWQVELTPPPGEVFLFETQHGDYRTEQWTVEGGRIEAHGFDILIREAETVRFEIEAPRDAPPGLPTLAYADGSSLFNTGQLALATVEDLETARALDGRWRNWSGVQLPVTVSLPSGGSASVQYGAGPFVGTDGRIGSSVDGGLPSWIGEAFTADWPRVEAALAERFADPIPPAVTHLGYAGEADGWHNTGLAVPPTIAMWVQTSANPEDQANHLAAIRWFFAHERVHHHQFAAGVGVRGWPLEGAADTFASATMVQLGWADEAWLTSHYDTVRSECAAELARGPVRNAPGRVRYVCGDLLNLAVWGSTGDLGGFWEGLLSDAKSQGARVDGSFFMYALRKRVDPDIASAFEHFETARHDDPDAALATLLETAGIVDDGEWSLGFLR